MKKMTFLLAQLGFCIALNAEVVANVTVQKAAFATLEKSVRGYGSIDFDSTALTTISLESQARVVSVKVVSGQKVKKGEIIATIAPSESDASALRVAEIGVLYAQKEKERVLGMKESALATNADVELASQNLDKALQTKAELSQKLRSVISKNLLSPIDGVVQSVMIKNGDIVSPQTPLITIAKAHRLVAKVGVEPSAFESIKVGQKALITPYSSGLKPSSGTVAFVSSQIDPKSRLVNVHIAIPNPKDLIAGDSVVAQIITGEQKGIVLPSTAVIMRKGAPYCFVVESNKARLRSVKIGFWHNDKTLITSGIRPNEMVITMGNYECEDGMSVNAAER